LAVAVTIAAASFSGVVAAVPAPVLAAAASLPKCPLSALQKAKGTVDIDFWESTSQANTTTLQALTTQFNSSQHKVHVTLVDQNGYTTTWQKYQAGLSNGQLPDVAQLTQTNLQGAIDTQSFLPAQSCINAAHYSTKDYVSRAISYWKVGGVQEALPFAVSQPIVYYNKQAFQTAGLDPTDPPATLPQYMADAKALKAHGSGTALVLDSWHLETWLSTANKLFVNNANGRSARATKAVFDNATALRIWTSWSSRAMPSPTRRPGPTSSTTSRGCPPAGTA
jgi:sn-glycerol 3-phosphate transport system substrate-binding protein